MGGKNHQPTRPSLIAASAWLSQQIGEGVILVNESNNSLENSIILAMDKLHVQDFTIELAGTPAKHMDLAIKKLQETLPCVNRIRAGYQRLLDAAAVEGYSGNPLISQLESYQLQELFDGLVIRPAVNPTVWRELEDRIISSNILQTLRWESSRFEELVAPTNDLIEVMTRCREIAAQQGSRDFIDSIENNKIPLRQYFARVFSLWNYLDAMFLYSALIMTELYYRANGFSSLAEFEPVSRDFKVA
jgi:hypothetical protein